MGIALRARYGMSGIGYAVLGTDTAYGATAAYALPGTNAGHAATQRSVLTARTAVPGYTGRGAYLGRHRRCAQPSTVHGAGTVLPLPSYAPPTPCPVLT
eukprot:2790870-Rhodomonas_salina.3